MAVEDNIINIFPAGTTGDKHHGAAPPLCRVYNCPKEWQTKGLPIVSACIKCYSDLLHIFHIIGQCGGSKSTSAMQLEKSKLLKWLPGPTQILRNTILSQIQSLWVGGWLAAPGSGAWLVMWWWPSRPFSPFVSCPTATHRSWSPQSSEMSLFTCCLDWTMHTSVLVWVLAGHQFTILVST